MKTVSYQEVLAVANAVVEELGADYVYPDYMNGCVYVKGNKPSCLVGHVLHRLGVDLISFASEESYDGGLVNECAIDTLWVTTEEYGVSFSPLAQGFLSDIQTDQDSGCTWGDAVERALH